jgi:hypothetical protein
VEAGFLLALNDYIVFENHGNMHHSAQSCRLTFQKFLLPASAQMIFSSPFKRGYYAMRRGLKRLYVLAAHCPDFVTPMSKSIFVPWLNPLLTLTKSFMFDSQADS